MTKKIVTILASLMLVAFGAESTRGLVSPCPEASDLEVLWANPYDFALLSWILESWGDYRTQDDFILTSSGWVKGFECWFLYADSPHPQPFEVTLRYYDHGHPGDIFWTAHVTDVTDTNTGDDLFGFDVWHSLLLLDEEDYVFIEAGPPHWLEIYWTGYGGAWCCEEDGNAYSDGREWDLSVFFTVLGTPSGAAVQPASWGEIKAEFSD
jgi:hypothetical protein